MNEPKLDGSTEPGTLGLDSASLESGAGILDRIASMPPQAEPVLVKARETAAGTASFKSNEAKPDSANEPTNEADSRKVLRVDPKDYSRVQDHKGRPFDPSIHKVKADGTPDFNARGKVKMLTDGEKNPVRLILDPLKNLLPKEPEPAQEVCEAQAAAQISDLNVRVNAECIADLYAGTGFIAMGGRFIKRWEKERRPRIITGLVNYERQVPGGLMKVAPWVVLAHVFASDVVSVAGGEMFDSGGGLFGWFKRLRMTRMKRVIDAGKAVPDAA